jgi:hypothetical protein
MTRRHAVLSAIGLLPVARLLSQTRTKGNWQSCVVTGAIKDMCYGLIRGVDGLVVQCELETTHAFVSALALQAMDSYQTLQPLDVGNRCFVIQETGGTYFVVGLPANTLVSVRPATVRATQDGQCQLEYEGTDGKLHEEKAAIARDSVGLFDLPMAGKQYQVITTADRLNYF